MGDLEKERCKKKKAAFFAFCLDDSTAVAGSYTVEVSVIMAMVLLAMALLIQAAYRQCRITTGTMRMHQMIEVLRHGKEEKSEGLAVEGAPYKIETVRKGRQVTGMIRGENWKRTIEQTVFEPEEFMRALTLVQE